MIQDIPQTDYNQIKGVVLEVIQHDEFPSFTLTVGQKTQRLVNIYIRKAHFDKIENLLQVGNKVSVMFFVSSRKKHGRYYTMANTLQVDPA